MSESNGELAFDTIQNASPDSDGFLHLPLMMIRGEVILPHTIMPLPLDYDEAKSEAAAHHAIEKAQTLIYVNQPKANDSRPIIEQIQKIGTEVAMVDITDEP